MSSTKEFLIDTSGQPVVAYHGTYYDFDYFFPLTHFGTEHSANVVLHEGKWKRDKNIDINKPKIIPVKFQNGNYFEIPDLNDHYIADWRAIILAILLDKNIIDDINKLKKWDIIEQKCKKAATKSLPYNYDFICEPIENDTPTKIITEELSLESLYDKPTTENLFLQRMILFFESIGIDGFKYANFTESVGQNSYIIFRPNNVVRLDKNIQPMATHQKTNKLRNIESKFAQIHKPRYLTATEISSWIKKLYDFYDFKIYEIERKKQ